MSKRKKQRVAGEELHLTKPPKNPRLRDSHGRPQSCNLGHLHHLKGSEDNSGPVASAELSREETGQAVSSCPAEEIETASRVLGPPEKEPVPPLPSQNSVRRFVPQFAKAKKTVTRKSEAREEDPESRAVSWEMPPEPDAQQDGSQPLEEALQLPLQLDAQHAGSQPLEEALRLPLQEAMGSGDQRQEDGAISKQNGLNSATPVPDNGHAWPEVTLEVGIGPSDSGRASQDPTLGVRVAGNNRSETQIAWAPGSLGQEKHLPMGDAKGKESDSRGPQEEGALGGGAGTKQPRGPQDEGDDIPCTPALAPASDPDMPCLKTLSVAQHFLVPMQLSSETSWEADLSSNSLACTSLGDNVITDVSPDPSELQQRALEVAMPGGQARQVPGNGCSSKVLLDYTPLAGEMTAGREETRLEEEPSGDDLLSLEAFLALAPRNQECTVDARDPGSPAQEMDPGVIEIQDPGPDRQSLGRMCTLPLQEQIVDQQATELGSQNFEQDFKCLGVSPSTSLLEHNYAASNLPQGTRDSQDSPGTPVGPTRQQAPDTGLTTWPEPSTMEIDFWPDSEAQNALNASDLEVPPEQNFPAESEPGLDWPGPSSCAIKELSSVAKAQSRTHVVTEPQQACRMQDATDTVRGLIIELSNLNRLIMITHRDLEAFKRRKAKLPGRAPLPCLSKGRGCLS